MNKIKENKKVFAIILIISLIAILLGSYAIYKNSYKTEKTAKSEKYVDKLTSTNADVSKLTKVEGKLIDKTTGKPAKGVKLVKNSGKSSNGEIAVKSENTGNGTKPSVKPVAKPETKPSAPSTPKPKEKQRIWIVDKAAWTETVTKYRNEQVTKYTCGGKIFDDYDSGYEYLIWCTDNGIECGNLGPTTVTVQVPYTETINHPEQGHYEYR